MNSAPLGIDPGDLLTIISLGEACAASGEPIGNWIDTRDLPLWEVYQRSKARALDEIQFTRQGGRAQ